MLILSRSLQEKVIINDDIRIIIVGVIHNTVRLGIEAPRYIPVYREEIYQKNFYKSYRNEKII